MVDIDLETVISFCDQFEKVYLNELHSNAARLKTAAASASATLGKTDMASGAESKLEAVADMIYKASAVGEERIKELKKKAQRELEEKDRINALFR